jgi:YfdX protein
MRYPVLVVFTTLALNAQPDAPGLAVGILDQTKLARQAISARDKDGAVDHIRQGLVNAGAIQQNLPSATEPILVPVYQEIETTDTYTPVKHKGGEMSADRLKKDSSIRGVTSNITVRKLDVLAAADHLRAAQAALQNGDWSGGDAALAAVASSVVVDQAQGDMPLDMARQNLELARARVLDGKYKDAVAPLRSAAQALGDFERNCSGEQASTVESVRLAMLGTAGHISSKDGTLGRIDAWLGSVSQWNTGVAR